MSLQEEAEGTGKEGPALHILGSVTKKIVVTPDFDIGIRPRGVTTSTTAYTGENDEDYLNMED